MREISFKYGSREKGWKYYTCTEKETEWDKQRAKLWGFEGNMCHWTFPSTEINIGRKEPIAINSVPMGMDFVKCNYNKLLNKLKSIVKNMQEENFEVEPESTTFYWELTISNYDVSNYNGYIGIRHNKYFRMWRGANYEPQGLQEIKNCFVNYFKNK